ncbi:MAG TPA: IPTL-CTERM sorting domain-containing protein [Rudaea sp.]|jgi:hypothetical protein|nr:IPTL-CTERM sorting domain-containing protein [Rudaea sp.]
MIVGSLRARRLLPLAIALALGVPAVDAATITVTTGGDAGTASTCTLRQALDSANNDSAGSSTCTAGSGADTVDFAANLRNSTITLAGQPLSIASDLTLTGSGQTIDANDLSTVMYIDPAATAYLSDLTLTGGNSFLNPTAGGVAIISPSSPLKTGGRFAPSAVKRTSPITHAPSAGEGIYMSRVTVTGNTSKYAGGMLITGTYATLYQCTVSNNEATGNASHIAGGIVALGAGVVIEDSTISGNTVGAGGAGSNGAALAYDSFLIFANSTVSGNSATGTDYVSGGVSQEANGAGKYGVAALNSTISGNTATATGTHVTGGVMIGGAEGAGNGYFVNSIIDGNTGTVASTKNIDVVDSPSVVVHSSLLGTELQTAFTGNGNVFAADPKLGPLANNGGPTLTRALLPASPAINAGDNSSTSNLTTDQRGAGFARIVGPAVDIGAFELQTTAAPAVLAAPSLSAWAAALLSGLLALFGIAKRRRS